MDGYETELTESPTGMWAGLVFHGDGEARTKIGETTEHMMRVDALEEAKRIAKAHKHGPEIVTLDV